jgi:YbgC/YbaW family acyl-CoA thioester hydrolase
MGYKFYTTVRGYELDSYNHLNNAVYLNYLEQARWEIFKEYQLFDYFKKNDFLLVTTEINIKYLREAKLFDELVVKTELSVEEPYLIFSQKIYNTGTELKISQAKVKTLLINKEKIAHNLPDELLIKMKLKK